jgi:hypothetical protein
MKEIIATFEQLGKQLQQTLPEEIIWRAGNQNVWFTPENIQTATQSIAQWLTKTQLQNWLNSYKLPTTNPQKVGIVVAGNIPLVGFHDLLCVLVSGHQAVLKLSSQDTVLMQYIIDFLMQESAELAEKIIIAEQLKGIDAVIATGSDNTARYFNYYFRSIPHIIRKNRTSVAALSGNENEKELKSLCQDIFLYFGLGCRNVSKLFVPKNYDLMPLLQQLERYTKVIQHHKYFNNYEYRKAILLINQQPFLDTGTILVQENTALVSPPAMLYYEYYDNETELQKKLAAHTDKIQCLVSHFLTHSVPFGQTQTPTLTDYADGIDTMQFLEQLS